MCAAEDKCVDERVLRKEGTEILVHEIIRPLVEMFARLDERYP